MSMSMNKPRFGQPYGGEDGSGESLYLESRSTSALLYSINEACPKGWVYLWTFTRKAKESVRAACGEWNKLGKELVRRCKFYGVRVYELHPGGHGLHVHVVTGGRFEVDAIRAVSNRAGWGRVDVTRIPGKRRHYVAKYVSKEREPDLKGQRLWACLGRFERTRISDIEKDAAWSAAFKSAMAEPWYQAKRAAGLPHRRLHRLLQRRAQVWWRCGNDADEVKRVDARTERRGSRRPAA